MAIRLTGIASGLDTDSMVQELVSAYSLKKENYEKEKTKLEWKQESWKELNTKVYSFYTGSLSSLRLASSFANKKTATVSDESKATVSAKSSAPNGTQTVRIAALAKAAYYTGEKVSMASAGKKADSKTMLVDLGGTGSGTIDFNMKDEDGNDKVVSVDVNAIDTIEDVVARIKDKTGLSASFDTSSQRFIINGESGAKNDFTISAGDEGGAALLQTLGFGDLDATKSQEATDAEIYVNGALFTSESNSITVNGLTINATGVSGDMTVNIATDTDGIYDMIKDFFSEYNNLINEMTKGYNAATAKGYDPLTDDEKEAMSESEIEKWEQKIKDSLLRRDDTLQSVISTMTSAMSKGVVIDGKTYHLSDFGIETLGYTAAAENEYNAYHISGNKDDTNSADKTDKLRAMIESNPEVVQKFFTGMAQNLYDGLHSKMLSTELRSAYTVYNDKELDSEMKDLKEKISDWEDKISNYEETWYNKFSKMETALTELQNQTSQLTALLGGNS